MATSDQSKTEYYGDQATAEDLLGFREHAERLADEISRFDPNLPMVVGIEGKWGEGKTSFLLMMEAYWRRQNKLAPEWPRLNAGWWWPHKFICALIEYIQFFLESIAYCVDGCVGWLKNSLSMLPREERQIRLVKFDPWWFSGKEKLLERFLDEIKAKEPFYALLAKGVLSGLKGGFDKHNRYWLKIFSSAVVVAFASSRFADLALLISREVTVPTKDELQTSIEIVSILSAVFAILFFMLIGEMVEKLLNFILPTDMEKKRARLERKLRRSPVQRIIIVDDIDRLPDDELQELFRVIKSVAAMPNIVYVLLYDRTAVAGVLDKLHANRGEQFLEKIVQLSIRLPTPTKTASQQAAYFTLTSLLVIKDLLSQTPIREEYQEGLELIVSSLIPNLRQAKRIANVVKISYKQDLKINTLLFVFLEALRLYSGEIWLRLCLAMINYISYPSYNAILLSRRNAKTTTNLSSEENEWMIKHGLINDKYELCPPLAGMPEKLIDCIVFFTGLILPGVKSAYDKRPFYIPRDIEADDQHLYRSDIFERYLQARLDENRLSEKCIQEELFTLASIAEVIQFIADRRLRFVDSDIDAYDIVFYFRELEPENLICRLDALFKLAKLAAASAESILLSQAKINLAEDLVRDCENIFFSFLALRQAKLTIDPGEALTKFNDQQKQLFDHAAKEAPLFHFKSVSRDKIKRKQAVLDKYSPKQALQILLKKESRCLGQEVFGDILLDTKNEADDDAFSTWLGDVSDKDLQLKSLLQNWMIASLKRENIKSRLPFQPKLAHLIEPLKRELESEGDDVALENLKVILEKNSNKTNP